jgi:hypothetical protein
MERRWGKARNQRVHLRFTCSAIVGASSKSPQGQTDDPGQVSARFATIDEDTERSRCNDSAFIATLGGCEL